MTVLVGFVVALGMVVVVPLGLRLMDDEHRRLGPITQIWPVAGLLGAVSLLLERGSFAVVLAGAYALVTAWLAVLALFRLLRRRSVAPVEIAILTAMVAPAIAATSLVAERGGYELFGFGMTVLALTVAHFHFAGFAAALVAGLAASTVRSVASEIAALTVPAGTALVLLGYFTSEEVELVGAAVLTAGMWMLGWVIWRRVRPASPSLVTRWLFAGSALILAATMVLALSWAAGHVWDAVPHLSLTWMAATHGIANALGFAVCGMLAWGRLRQERRHVENAERR
ncbi:YndJ family transporter [Phytoactinopolyspora alkaliphila]|uniref:YndJ family transporter n=1 Tax=Phytoactinopolyspora alkaliphila TaxID=1783498 RepID=A0A6N9YKX2_9ACTN|nr:YndJ family transporter [Phytoactinopolyspora alkaliphila]